LPAMFKIAQRHLAEVKYDCSVGDSPRLSLS